MSSKPKLDCVSKRQWLSQCLLCHSSICPASVLRGPATPIRHPTSGQVALKTPVFSFYPGGGPQAGFHYNRSGVRLIGFQLPKFLE